MMECVSDSTAGGGTGGVSCASDDGCDFAAGKHCNLEMMECVSDSTADGGVSCASDDECDFVAGDTATWR